MKRALLVSFGLIMLGSYAGCLPEETTPTGTGGSQGTAGTGVAGTRASTAGTGVAGTGVAGTTGTGGTAGSQGGDTSGTAGNGTAGTGTAGTGTAGSGTGGTGGTGTAGTGTAGTTSRGGTGGTGTAGTGTAGTTSRGGTGGTGTAGSSGGTGGGVGGATAGSGGTSAALPTVGELFPLGHRRLTRRPAPHHAVQREHDRHRLRERRGVLSTRRAHQLHRSGALNVMHTYPVGGVTGRQYKVTIHFYGIAEPKNYGGVTREATGTTRPTNSQTNGGMSLAPTPWAQATAVPHTYNVSDYNTNEIHVCRTRHPNERRILPQCRHAGGALHVRPQLRETDHRLRRRHDSRPQLRPKLPSDQELRLRGQLPLRLQGQRTRHHHPRDGACRPCPAGALMQPNLSSSRSADNAGQWLLIDVESVDSQM